MSSKPPKSFTDPARTKPIGMLRYAIEFYAAALATDDAIGDMDGYEITAPDSSELPDRTRHRTRPEGVPAPQWTQPG